MLTIKSKKRRFGINFPTNLSEVSVEDLVMITENVMLPPHYCIVALCFETKLFDFVTAINSNRSTNVAVTPLLAKISKEDSETINAKVGERLIIDRTNLERGVHVNCKTAISLNSARKYFNSDEELIKNFMTNTSKEVAYDTSLKQKVSAKNAPNIIIMEFKIVPVNDIAASVTGITTCDPYVVLSEDCQA